MTTYETLRGTTLLNELGQALNSATFADGGGVVRMTLALERLAVFFDATIDMGAAVPDDEPRYHDQVGRWDT